MARNLLSLFPRRDRFKAKVAEELNFLNERYGTAAADGAKRELARPDLAPDRRKLLEAALKDLV